MRILKQVILEITINIKTDYHVESKRILYITYFIALDKKKQYVNK